MSELRILLVRHGESTWNADGRWQGQADPPLTDRGRAQARAAVAGLPARIDLLVASDLGRARETADILGAGAGHGPARVDVDLRERDAGAFSGLTRAEIHERYPGLLPDDPARAPGTEGDGVIAPPGWEPQESLAARAWGAIDRVAGEVRDSGGSTVVGVTHSGLIYALEADLGAARSRIANLEGRWIEGGPGGWRAGDRHLLFDPSEAEVTSPDQL